MRAKSSGCYVVGVHEGGPGCLATSVVRAQCKRWPFSGSHLRNSYTYLP